MFGLKNSSAFNILVKTILQKNLTQAAKKYLKGNLLDIGCGTKPYKEVLSGLVDSHTGIDYPGTLHDRSNIDIFCTAYNIPYINGYFDSAICTATLEHLEEPEIAIRECFRVLRSGGVSIYSVPFIWHLHEEPRDFYRYSKYGLDYLFKKSGFDVLEIKALSGFWVTFGQLFVYYLYRLNRGPIRWLHLLDIPGWIIQGISLVFDKLDKAERWTWMYMVIARKP